MTAVIYARYSSDNQREESIEGQSCECTAYAEKNGITVVKHYIDRAISAKTDNRPEFQHMLSNRCYIGELKYRDIWCCKTRRTPTFPSMRNSFEMRSLVSRICSTRFKPAS